MKIYTRTGDRGETGLFGGGRVAKDHPRVRAYGDVDELNSAIGVARAAPPAGFEDALLDAIQRDLFTIGARLATLDTTRVPKAADRMALDPARVAALETAIDRADQVLPALRAFVLPGGGAKAAALHLARTICRRAEREVVALARDDADLDGIVVYLNRLSDLLFTLARLANHEAGTGDVTW